MKEDKWFQFYCMECLVDCPNDCICKKILRYDKETGIPVVNLTNEECEYLSKCGINKNEDTL